MSFNKTPPDHTHANQSAKSCLSTISPGLVVVGNVSSAAEIHVEGRILGDVRCSRLLIGLGGLVEGKIFAQHVEVRGEIAGGASARSVFVASTGRVNGHLLVEKLSIEPGGRLDGHCGRAGSRSQNFATVASEQTPIKDEAVLSEAAEEVLAASATEAQAHTTTKRPGRLAKRRPLGFE